MSKKHPTPWTFHAVDACEDQPILDANGNEVLVRDSGVYPPDLETCHEIVEAVNWYCDWGAMSSELERLRDERDRLRDIVREALPFIEGAIDGVSTILGDAEMSKAAVECGAPPKDVQEAFVADGRRVLREARAAIGENAPHTEEKGGDK